MPAKALHILGGISQEQPHLMGEPTAPRHPGRQMVQHGLQPAGQGIAVPLQQTGYLLLLQLALQAVPPVHQYQTAAAAPAQGPQRDPRPSQGGGVGRQQGVGLISFPWEGNEIRRLDACQGRRTVKGQGQLKARFGRPDLGS